MKIETKLTYKNIQSHKKRTIYTTISIILCTVLLLTTILLITSVRGGMNETIAKEYNDYHFIIKNMDMEKWQKIKDKEFIEKIYVQESEQEPLKEIKSTDNIQQNSQVYIKCKNVKNVCENLTDIVQTLWEPGEQVKDTYKVHQKLLTVYGLMDVDAQMENDIPVYTARVNYSYVIDIMIVATIVAFSILFITILYNAFWITINERKREYAILNSVGTTEGQILKMVFREAMFMGIVGIIIGGGISCLCASGILNILNTILASTGYNFSLVINAYAILVSIAILVINLYLSAVIPSIKASTSSVMQGIRNNKEITYKKKESLLERILPIEGKLAIKNSKRNKSKYRVITLLLVVCMTAYIATSTYMEYEKVSAEVVTEYDVDAEMEIGEADPIVYQQLLYDYEKKVGDKVEAIPYRMMGIYVHVEPAEALIKEVNTPQRCSLSIVGLEEDTYQQYIKKIRAHDGDSILYNIAKQSPWDYTYATVFKSGYAMQLTLMDRVQTEDGFIDVIVDEENLAERYVFTDKLLEGFQELKMKYLAPVLFVNQETYHKIEEKIATYTLQHNKGMEKWLWRDRWYICQNKL